MATPEHTRLFRVGFMACGLGAGALGFIQARASLGKRDRARFINLGGIDIDEHACQDFEYLTGAKATRADLHTMTPAELRAVWGDEAPDVIFSSPPCKGFSRLLPKKQAALPKYQLLNQLVFKSFWLACETWSTPPGLLVLENVEGIKSRGAVLLAQLRSLLAPFDYAIHEAVHDCGEIGGLAQHRDRYLFVARLRSKVREYVYRPPRQRVKGCGEVLGQLPVPGISGDAAGPLHVLPKISWLNMVRLALIPAGKDWRALPKNAGELSLKLAAANASSFKGRPGLMGVQDWNEPAPTVTGSMKVSGGNATAAVADPRAAELALGYAPVSDSFGVQDWRKPSKVVRGKMDVRTAPAAVADPRAVSLLPQAGNAGKHHNKYAVASWARPVKTLVGASRVGSGAQSVADPRALEALRGPERFGHCDKVSAWSQPVGTVTHAPAPSSGGTAVADPRAVDMLYSPVPEGADPRTVFCKYDVRGWAHPARTVAGSGTNGGYAVADPLARTAEAVRIKCKPRNGAYGVMSWADAARTITGAGQVDNATVAVADPRKAPDALIVIVSEDGCWHRPITMLEMAVLQGLPHEINGKPLRLAGTPGKSATKWRERIGNAVPRQAGIAIGESLLTALLATATGQWTLSREGVWVERDTGRTEYDYEFVDDQAAL